jgi:ADP-ribose pyrophosphatase YjhB (NUDIX family)
MVENHIVFGCICVNPKGETLLVHGRNSNKWSFPKGHREEGEDGLTCAKREMLEETGITLTGPPLFTYYLKGGQYYLFELDHDILTPLDNTEIDKVAWFSLLTLPNNDCNVDISIIRILMKSIRQGQKPLDFLRHSYATRRIAMILDNMARAKAAKAANAAEADGNTLVDQ